MTSSEPARVKGRPAGRDGPLQSGRCPRAAPGTAPGPCPSPSPAGACPRSPPLRDELPDLHELFTFMRDAELRFATLRMRLEEHSWTARGEEVLVHDVTAAAPGRGEGAHVGPGGGDDRRLRDVGLGRRHGPDLRGVAQGRHAAAGPSDGPRRDGRRRPPRPLPRLRPAHGPPDGVAARPVRPSRRATARTSSRRATAGSSARRCVAGRDGDRARMRSPADDRGHRGSARLRDPHHHRPRSTA